MADLNTEDIVTAVRGKLSDTAFDHLMIVDALNFFVNEIYNATRTRRMETNDQIFVSAGDTTADLPDDVDVWTRMTVTSPVTNIYDLKDMYYQYDDFMRAFPKWKTDIARAITAWTDFGNQMRFSAPVLAATTIDIDYCRKPIQATITQAASADTVELDSAYKEMAVLGTLARCMESNEDYAEASSERNNLAPLITTWVRNEGRGQGKTGPVVMRSNRVVGGYTSRNRDW